ncbi:pyridoxal-phosphate dependent enzyme [Maribacter sp. ANRC-HE7]|uniref:Pyridoxal-phosphate dependent enzyme n=1 Tax=Maribacter aquimaris TaxID=2737171 RepID=A0ABR7V6N6_9FLAO|nr:pyridoxal-phosphate dependent enzyme [Maribacter aquimaris]MBD0779614.1 pyridoxal-phosphate dependent enzyme [Maribacter aquimaris]
MQKNVLIECHQRIAPFIHETPIFTSHLLNGIAGTELFFKCENFQRMGAYKMRGATNAILQLTEGQRAKGVVTHSSGNFAQALSLAAKSLGVKAYIVMPSSAPQVKKDAVKGYSGTIIECVPTLAARNAMAREIQSKTGATFIHPSNDLNVIAGQGTACMELLREQPDLDVVVVPVGGGGLIAGTALAAHHFGTHCKVVGAEPFEVDDAYRSLKSGKIESNDTTNTIADGLKTQLGDKSFPLIQKYVEGIVRVGEDEIIEAMKLVWERMKIIIEPSSAVAFAAVLRKKNRFIDKKVGIIISGGNVDLKNLPF